MSKELSPIPVDENELKMKKGKKRKKVKEELIDVINTNVGVETLPIIEHVSPVIVEKHNMTEKRKAALANARRKRMENLERQREAEREQHQLLIRAVSEMRDYLKNVSSAGTPPVTKEIPVVPRAVMGIPPKTDIQVDPNETNPKREKHSLFGAKKFEKTHSQKSIFF